MLFSEYLTRRICRKPKCNVVSGASDEVSLLRINIDFQRQRRLVVCRVILEVRNVKNAKAAEKLLWGFQGGVEMGPRWFGGASRPLDSCTKGEQGET